MTAQIKLAIAAPTHHIEIAQIRHTVYATELGQFAPCPSGTLHDRSDVNSVYITASENGRLIGFVGVTPPESPTYSLEHYISRSDIPIRFDRHLFEIRALTVVDSSRGSVVAPALMYAAFRWIQSHGGTHVVAIAHSKVEPMYRRLGMRLVGMGCRCGHLQYELLEAPVKNIETELTRFESRLNRLEKQVTWQLEIPFRPPAECYHGGAFFEAIGNTFETLDQRNTIINADVLDAWFPPCPEALKALHEHLGWLARTSPPNHAEGLAHVIAKARGVAVENILAGGGSSPLIFLAFRHWLTPASKVLILDPMYGEYAHVLEKVIGCTVERFKLHREDGYALNTQELTKKLTQGFDQVVWVNPNSPTGRHVVRSEVETVLNQCPVSTRVWIDETYIEYAERGQSMEVYAASSPNVVVVKSMSKVYGLSGLRVGYLCGPRSLLEPLRSLTPPWSVSLPAQVAAIHALRSSDYYASRYRETHQLRVQLVKGLEQIGIQELIPGVANFIMFHLPDEAPCGQTVIKRCRKQGLFIRDAGEMGKGMGDRVIRIAVKDAESNKRMLQILETAVQPYPTTEEVLHD